MKRRFRLTRSADFERVRRSGKAYAHPLIVLIAYPSGQESSRFIIVAGRALGNAVRRNRARRLIRAALGRVLSSIEPGWDIVIFARQRLLESIFQDIQDALGIVLARAGLLRKTDDL